MWETYRTSSSWRQRISPLSEEEVFDAQKVSSSSRQTPFIAAYARVAPSSAPGLMQKQTASTSSNCGSRIRKQSPNHDVGSPDFGKFTCVRRDTLEYRTIHVTGPEDAGHSANIGERKASQSSNALNPNSRKGQTFQPLSPPLWNGQTSQFLPGPSSRNQIAHLIVRIKPYRHLHFLLFLVQDKDRQERGQVGV